MSDSDSLLLRHRIVWLAEPINARTANRVVGQLLHLNAEAPDQPIEFYINSSGGSVADALAIIDAMDCLEAPVATVCIGRAASMAAWILACGTSGHRAITPHSEVVIHGIAPGALGLCMEESTTGIFLDVPITGFAPRVEGLSGWEHRRMQWQSKLAGLLAKRTGRNISCIAGDMAGQRYLTAEEAVAYGLADHVIVPARQREAAKTGHGPTRSKP